ncbi:MAG TPA: hypothetical protein VNL18_01300 [Gemmatimonadales bacterium]|nr:hypothetical protein [Armatimonadota bacterium]HWP36164.1 hypothetical protein [Gemmatimonadales bacterium]
MRHHERTLVIVRRGEPPSIAAKSIVTSSGSLGQVRRVFNALLDYLDERERPMPYLAEALPYTQRRQLARLSGWSYGDHLPAAPESGLA